MDTRFSRFTLALVFLLITAAAPGQAAEQPTRLSTGAFLDPAAGSFQVGEFPLGIAVAPDGRHAALLLSGAGEQGVQLVDLESREVVQMLVQPSAFVGVAFSPDGKLIAASGGNEDTVVLYPWADGRAASARLIHLAAKKTDEAGRRYPAGLAFSSDGSRLFVAENLSDSLAVIDMGSGEVIQRMLTDRYPYGVVVSSNGDVFVSSWGDNSVMRFRPDEHGRLVRQQRIETVRHPAAMLLDDAGQRLYVTSPSTDRIAVLDRDSGNEVTILSDAAPRGPSEGVTPNALALGPKGDRLFVAEADANAVAVLELSGLTSRPQFTVPSGPPRRAAFPSSGIRPPSPWPTGSWWWSTARAAEALRIRVIRNREAKTRGPRGSSRSSSSTGRF